MKRFGFVDSDNWFTYVSDGEYVLYSDAAAKIKRLEQQVSDLMIAKKIIFQPPAMPESEVLDYFRKHIEQHNGDYMRLRVAHMDCQEKNRELINEINEAQRGNNAKLAKINRLTEALNRIADPEDNENPQCIALEAIRAESV